MKYKTIQEGEQAVVYNLHGEGRLVEGPCRIFLFRERLHMLKLHTANQYEYLKLKDKDGYVTHKRGPCSLFFNPLSYEEISLHKAIQIDANHLIVVYKRVKDGSVQRRIVQGPNLFVPEPEEWLHEFRWHGSDPENKARMIPSHNVFTQLAVIPDQFYYNVHEVRTTDDTMITIKLMLFYTLRDVVLMLDTTHDPIADMINALCADVISFISRLSYDEFLKVTHKLSELESYSQLMQRAERIGYQVQKVVFRGYHASEQLQAMQNSAIESRTQLRLNAEIEDQKQKLADFKFAKEQARTKLKQEMEKSKQEHQQKLDQMRKQHSLELQELTHAQKLQLQEMVNKIRLEHEAAEDNHSIKYLENLKSVSVNLTKYLSLQNAPNVNEEVVVVSQNKRSS
ncbi:hypothetical protein ACJMK2_026122 [Sinanodonta woodiana]|uniref:Band 7 domain-containing protein n=1 Tax=Sinanodonta woodiana TaxID=1069815 RepID=A0ABD3XIK3_SINWO